MKMQLRKKTRIILMVVLVCAMITTGVLAYFLKDKVEKVESEIVVLDYKLMPEISSRFYLIKNTVYEELYLNDTEVIINQLINHIDSAARLTLTSQTADYMNLEIIQYEKLETYFGDGYVVWSRVTESENQILAGKEQILYEHENSFSLEEFKMFLAEAYKTLELSPKGVIKIVWDVKGAVTKGDKVLEIDKTFEVQIPLYDNMFMINKDELIPHEDVLTEKIVTEVPTDPMILKAVGAVSAFSLVLLVLSLLTINTAPEMSSYEKLKKQIFNNYDDRLAELEESVHNVQSNMIAVVKIEDLVKISDEIRQPVFYHAVENPKEKQLEFFVFDETRIYHLVIYDENEMTVKTFIGLT